MKSLGIKGKKAFLPNNTGILWLCKCDYIFSYCKLNQSKICSLGFCIVLLFHLGYFLFPFVIIKFFIFHAS